MRGSQSVAYLDGYVQDLFQGKSLALNGLLQSLSLDALHRDKDLSLMFTDLMDDSDVLVRQGSGCSGFVIEAFFFTGIARESVRQELQSNIAV